MRYVIVKHLKPGMILGKDITATTSSSKNEIMLAKENMILTERIIEQLKNKGITGIYIKDDLTKGLEITETINETVKRITLEAIKNKDINSIITQSKEMVASVYLSKDMEIDLLKMIETRDTEGHSMNVCELSLFLGKAAGFDETKLQNLATTALLHDIGKFLTKEEKEKLEISETLTEKCKELNMDKDYFLHPIYSYAFLSKFPDISAVTKQSILFHHEAIDGSGFPFGVKGDKISEFSQIISICDWYELNLKRYGNPIDAKHKVEENYAYGMYNEKFMNLFSKKMPIYPKGATVKLSTGDLAVVLDNNDNYPERPIVRLLDLGYSVNLLQINTITVIELYCGNQEIKVEQENKNIK